jgi:hypothetical protein
MTAWVRNIPNTWANRDGWRTDIALTTLGSSGYDIAEFHLEDGTRVKIPMEEMRRALRTANIRTNRMVGPFNVNPHEQTVNGERVTMEIRGQAHHERPSEVRQIPVSITPDLLSEDGSFIPFSSFLVRYRRPALSDDDLRKAHRALQNLYHKTRPQMANADESPLTAEGLERSSKPLVLDTGNQDVLSSDSQVLPRKRGALLQKSPAVIALCVVLLLVTIVFLILRYFR